MQKYFIYIFTFIYSFSFAQNTQSFENDDYGDRLKIGFVWKGELSFNPLQINSDYDAEFAKLVFGDGLFTTNDNGSIIKNIVLEYNVLSSTVLRFKLKPNLKFQDNSFITAKDVKQTFELYNKFSSQSKQLYNAKYINSIETYGEDIVRIKLLRPLTDFSETLGQLPVLPAKTCVQLFKHEYISDFPFVKPIGFGHFQFSDYNLNSSVKLENFNSHAFGKSYLDGIDLLFYESQDLLLNAFLREEVDLIQIHDKSEIQKIKQFARDIVQVVDGTETVYYINLNTRIVPFNDFSIRHAINYAINKKQIANSLYDKNGNNLIEEPKIEYSLTSNYFLPFEYKPIDGLQILLNNNFRKNTQGKLVKNNKELQFDLYLKKGSLFEEYIARIIAINLGEIGVSVTPISIEPASLKEKILNGEYEAVLKKYTYDPNYVNITLINFYLNELNSLNRYQNFKNLSFDLLTEYMDDNQREDDIQNLSKRFQNLLRRYSPCIFLFFKESKEFALNPRFNNILKFKTTRNGDIVNQLKPKYEWFVKKDSHKY